MSLKCFALRVVLVAFLALLASFSLPAQVPPSIQVFMPDGSLPPREIRFLLSSESGLAQTYVTDSKGRFLITGKEGIKPDVTYTITITGDGHTFATTTQSFKLSSVYYIPISLRPIEDGKANLSGVRNVKELDEQVPEEARAALNSATLAMREGRHEEAVERFQHAIHLYPKYFHALNDLGVLLIGLNRIDEAAKAFEQAIAIAPQIYHPRLNLAIIKTRKGKYKEAVELLEKLQKENPALVQIRTALIDALLSDNRFDEAEIHLRAVLKEKRLPPANAGNLYYQLGLIHNRQHKYAEAAEELTKALKTLPYAPRVYLQLGDALLNLNRLEEGESALQSAYRLGGAPFARVQLVLGKLYYSQKRYDLAKRAFERYLLEVPKAPNRQEVLGIIEFINAAMTPK